MKFIYRTWLSVCCLIFSIDVLANVDYVAPNNVDFIHYKANLEPNFSRNSLTGSVSIKFSPKTENITQITFSAKYKTIYSVTLEGLQSSYTIEDEKLKVKFKQPLIIDKRYVITVEYQATPERGMKFYKDHLFTVYHTKNWLVSHDAIADKASFELSLIHDKRLSAVGNGRLITKKESAHGKVVSHFLQESSIPIYTFGFALGGFKKLSHNYKNTAVSYIFRKQGKLGFTTKDIADTFVDVPDMIDFFEKKAGFSLPNAAYQYVVVEGYMAQEATGFSLVGEKYLRAVQADKNENWFIAHELAHEWWGNSITCANFSHFWLNEGLVQFLVAAYKQHRFGEAAYIKEINIAVARVNRAVDKGKVSPVAFKHQIEEKYINRTMVYSKGALIFYMLRGKLGEEIFWRALKEYSINNQQGSVTTNDLKMVFEKVSRQDLTDFFNRWVYGKEIPIIRL